MEPTDLPDKVRVDKWLWAARFFKTRSLAADAIEGGKIEVNGDRAKRAKQIGVGDELRVRLGPYEHVVRVLGTSERRGPATEAQQLYEETEASRMARARLAEQHKLMGSSFDFGEGKPTKKDRRTIDRWRGRGG